METQTARERSKPSNGQPEQVKEGPVARSIESKTAKMPSDLFLWGAGAAVVGSLTLMILGKKQTANFLGQWAPTLLLLGVYNKIVKVAGHEGGNVEDSPGGANSASA